MTSYRFALGAIALAVCQVAVAQQPPAATFGGGTNMVTQPEGGAPAAVQPAGASAVAAPAAAQSGSQAAPAAAVRATASPAGDGAAAGSAAKSAAASAGEPRILRGNDQVIAAPKQVPPIEGAPVSFEGGDAPVAEVVRTILGDMLGFNFVLHPPIAGTVTLSTRRPVPPDQAVFLLESALQANGLALSRDARGAYQVGRPEVLRSIGAAVRQAGPASPGLPPGYGAVVVTLQYIGAAEMAAILRPLMPSDALVRVDTVRNLLVLAGTRSQTEGWMDLINTFDVDLLKGMSVGVFPLKHATTREVEAALRLVSGGAAAGASPVASGSANAAAANAASAQGNAMLGEGNPLFGALRIMPIERINSILVVTPRAAYLDEARRWIERLDQPSDNSAEPQLFIYQVQNGNARHLATVLSGIFGGTGTTATPQANSGVAPGLGTFSGSTMGQSTLGTSGFGTLGSSSALGNTANRLGGTTGTGFGNTGLLGRTATQNQLGTNNAQQSAAVANIGGIRVMADELNNSVLVWGTRTDYHKIEATLKRLDLPPTQVMIEASIIEVSLTDDLSFGLQWAFNDSRSTTDWRGRGALANAANGVFSNPPAGFSYTLRSPAGDVRAVLNALSKKTFVKVLASPSLMVLDNHTAAISVGTQQPIKTGETVSTEGNVRTTNIQYKDTGVNLSVTPSVNAGNIVTMQVEQSVTDVGAVDTEATGQRQFLQRQVSSKVAVRSGESIVMGGLIQENGTSGKSGLPGLSNVPILGNLFGTTENTSRRTELLVVITPRVVRSDVDIREVSDDLRDRLRGLRVLELKEQEAATRRAPGPTPTPSPNAAPQ
ncbi:MAG: type II secretion system secretin GspD [Burkholderiaceae bacterium]